MTGCAVAAGAAALESLAHELTILTATVHDLDRGDDPLTTIKTCSTGCLRSRPTTTPPGGRSASWRA
jgi:hypothetical protein